MDHFKLTINKIYHDLNKIYTTLSFLKEQSWIANFHSSETWFFDELNTLNMLVAQFIFKINQINNQKNEPESSSCLSDASHLLKFRFCTLMQNLKNCPLVEDCFNKENIFCHFQCSHPHRSSTQLNESEPLVK